MPDYRRAHVPGGTYTVNTYRRQTFLTDVDVRSALREAIGTLRSEWINPRRKKRNQSTLWQHRFWEHLIRHEADFNRHIVYIH